jgi:hypothetical protein
MDTVIHGNRVVTVVRAIVTIGGSPRLHGTALGNIGSPRIGRSTYTMMPKAVKSTSGM